MIGATIVHYRIPERLGEGNMGVVYRAQDLKLNRSNSCKLSPKGIDISTEGNALGSDHLALSQP